MKKFFQIILRISFLFLLVGCSSQETATFTHKSNNAEFIVTYTYDKKNDTVTKIKIEMNNPSENTQSRKRDEKLSREVKENGVLVSFTEKDGKRISLIEIDVTKYKLSSLNESDKISFINILSRGFLADEGDHVSFSKSKENMLKYGFKEEKK